MDGLKNSMKKNADSGVQGWGEEGGEGGKSILRYSRGMPVMAEGEKARKICLVTSFLGNLKLIQLKI